jgi:hypothetical protein
MSDSHAHYRFGDITRMTVAWLGPHARAIKGEVDWVKFGKALVLGFLATGTVTFVSTFGALVGAIRDPDWATGIPAVLGVLVYAVEQVRRILQGKKADVPPVPVTPEDPSRGQHQEVPAQSQVPAQPQAPGGQAVGLQNYPP